MRTAILRQTAELTGVAFGDGVYINYLFLAVWLADAAWWSLSPGSRAARPRILSIAVRGFLVFIVINGAVVFANGWARVMGLASLAFVAAAHVRGWAR